jgi:hypothetical protein
MEKIQVISTPEGNDNWWKNKDVTKKLDDGNEVKLFPIMEF